MPYTPRFPKTDLVEFVKWLDELDLSDAWERNTRFVTDKGVYILSVQPVTLNGCPVRFDLEAANGSCL